LLATCRSQKEAISTQKNSRFCAHPKDTIHAVRTVRRTKSGSPSSCIVGLGADSTLSDAQFSALSGNIAVPKRLSDDVKYAKHLSPPIVAKDSSSRMAIMLYDDRHSFAYDHTDKLLFGLKGD